MTRITLMGLSLAGVLALVTACERDPLGRTASELRAEETACLAQGGEFAPGGLFAAKTCFLPLADGGQACTKESDCTGMCIANEDAPGGICSSVSPMFGCIPFLDENGERSEICID